MVVLNAALLSLLLPAAVLARPNIHEKLHHKRQGGLYDNIKPTGYGPTAPFPAGNQTQGAATASGSGTGSPVTIQSIISVVPLPPTGGLITTGGGLGGPGGSGGAGESGSPVQTGAPNGGSGEGAGNGEVCGPATVTVTSANTVTVTVPAGGAKGPSLAPSAPKGSVGGAGKDSSAVEAPKASSSPTAAPVQKPVSPKELELPKESASTEKNTPQVDATSSAQPAAEKSTTPETPITEEKKVKKPADVPQYDGQTPQQPKEETKPKEDTQPKEESQPSAPSSSSAPEQSSTPSKPSGDKVKARGILYDKLDEANAMTNVGWGCNWDSSELPAVGKAQGSLNFEFVPQLWGPDSLHTGLWTDNSKGHPWAMGFNEPNIGKEGGGCGPMSPSAAIAPFEDNMRPNKDAGQKITSPCVSNNAPEWLEEFLGSTSLKVDAVCFHWYGISVEGLKEVVPQFQKLQKDHGIAELWMTEWAFTSDVSKETADAALAYLAEAGVDRYAYNSLQFKPNTQAAYTS